MSIEQTMHSRGPLTKTFWIILLAPLCTGCGPSSLTNGAQGRDRESPRRGSVFGVVFEPQQMADGVDKLGMLKFRLDPKRPAWAFADGKIVPENRCGRWEPNLPGSFSPIPFKTDAQGRFRVDNVPVGRVAVKFESAGGDIISTFSRITYVREGESTEVRFFEPSDAWNVTGQFVIGDGSRAQFLSGTGMGAERKVEGVTTHQPMFRVDLEPKESKPVSFGKPDWYELHEEPRILMRDVHPGKYHAVIGGWLMSIGVQDVLAEQDLDVKPGHAAFTVRLAAGSITGAVEWSKPYRYLVHVLAIGKTSHAFRQAYCDRGGNFCVRYLDPDEYVLVAHDYDAGWCRIGEVAVANNIPEVGTHKLGPGGTITGRVPASAPGDRSLTVVATDSRGFAINWPTGVNDPMSTTFTISGLWPGKWTLTLRKCDHQLAQKSAVLRGAESVTCDFDGN